MSDAAPPVPSGDDPIRQLISRELLAGRLAPGALVAQPWLEQAREIHEAGRRLGPSNSNSNDRDRPRAPASSAP